MEEPIWLFFGILLVFVALGVVAGVVVNHNAGNKIEGVHDAMKKFEVQCNFVCQTSQGNKISIDATLPSGVRIYTSNDKICSEYDESFECIRCNCDLEEYEFDLSNSSVAKEFSTHKYSCFFEKNLETVSLECLG